jgi:TP901 family phage tail tape measure protein
MADLALNIIIRAANQASPAFGQVARDVASINPATAAVAAGAVAAAGAMAVFAKASVDSAADFQQSMKQSEALAGVTEEGAKRATEAILKMAPALGQTPQQMADGFYYIASTGMNAADSMKTLEIAAKAASVGNTDTKITANALTAALATYGLGADQAAAMMDKMVRSVASGKTEFQDYAKVIGTVAVTAKKSGIAFEEATSAFSQLTNTASTSKDAKNVLDAFLETSSKFDLIAARADDMGVAFNKSAYSTMNLKERMQYLMEITHGNKEAITHLLGQTNAMRAVTALATNDFESYDKILQSVSNSHGALDTAFAKTQEGFNAQMNRLNAAWEVLKIKVGNMLLPVLTELMKHLTPIITSIGEWADKSGMLIPILSGLATTIGVILVAAFYALATAAWTAAAPVLAATWPILAIAAAIGILVAGFLWLYNNVAPFKAFMDNVGRGFMWLWDVIVKSVSPALQLLWDFLVASFMPVWQQLVITWETQVIPAWNNLLVAIQPVLPQLLLFAQFIGVVVVGAILFVIGIIGGLIGALGGLLVGIVIIIGGIITYVIGVLQVISGSISFFVDLFTGKWDKLGGDLAIIWGGIVMMFQGIWQVIQGIFVGAINGIIGLMNGFVAGIIGPLNAILVASGKAAISVGQIPMLTVTASGGFAAMPTYKPLGRASSGQQDPFKKQTDSIQAQIDAAKKQADLMKKMGEAMKQQSQAPSPVTSAINNASNKSTEQSIKTQQAQQAALAKLADKQKEALAMSSSPQVKALVEQSKQMQKQGNMSMAEYYAQKATSLANDEHAAAQRDERKAQAEQQHKETLTKAEERKKQTLASRAAQHKEQIDAILAQCMASGDNVIKVAAGVALPNYATGTGYIQRNVAQAASGTQHITVNVHTNTKDAKEHGKTVANEVKKELAKHLRSGSVAPRYTSGGTRP